MDYNKYIGLPYKDNGRDENGVDCWGLARLFYANELNIDLPSYDNLYTTTYDPAVTEAINIHKDNWEQTKTGKPGDLCLFNIYGEPAHVGVYVGSRKFLHAREGKDSVVESLDAGQWTKRFQGFYRYSENAAIQVSGAPHPLRTSVAYDWTVEGTTVTDFVNFVNEKYKVSKYLASKFLVLVDGIVVPQDKWDSTVLVRGQTVAYKTVPEGRSTLRLVLIMAVFAASGYYAPGIGESLAGAGASKAAIAGYTAAVGMAMNMAGMALVNAIAPVRQSNQSDPGSANQLSMFSGSSNQANRFGAIPVVLGKMRVTGLHGATPYIDTLTDTSLINMIIVWGFGPLQVSDICVGANPIKSYYENNFAQNIPAPVTLSGRAGESETLFNQIYSSDVEQAAISPLELTNNSQDGNPWRYAALTSPANELAIALSFPEGMRQLVISGNDSGKVNEAYATVEIQVRRYTNNPDIDGQAWGSASPYFNGQYGTSIQQDAPAYTEVLTAPYYETYDTESSSTIRINLYRWSVFCLTPGGGIVKLEGAATDNPSANPSTDLLTMYKSGAYSSLTGTDDDPTTYTAMPIIPGSYVPIYAICMRAGVVVDQINYLQGYQGYTGLGLTLTPNEVITTTNEDTYTNTISTTVTINPGNLYQQYTTQPDQTESEPVFDSLQLIAGNVIKPSSYKNWTGLLKDNGVWTTQVLGNNDPFTAEKTGVVFKYSGYYHVEAACDDEGGVYVDNRPVVLISKPGWKSTVSNLVYIEAGTYPVRVTGKNSQGGMAAIACKITYQANGGLNNLPTPDTVLAFGTTGFYNKRKDAFNFVYRVKNLPTAKYQIRVRRANSDETEPADDLRNYHKVALHSLTGFNVGQAPIKALPNNTYLARTAIRLQSTNKANGNIDGINAIVETVCDNWNKTTSKWEPGKTSSNPASLFLYVLTHPANAYRVEYADRYSKINMVALQEWHEFCDLKNLRYNAIITSTQSVLDTLRDIAAAGLASPNFVDGKWTVVVDRAREYVTQHFTPHNSWGFEAVKMLPRLPDAFRVSFANEDKAYQADETIVYNYGKTSTTAKVFEELSMPGVTSLSQAQFMAKWHLAQLKLRPERYTLNVDFEYLVCNRGDLVRVTHDIPLWGLSSGRIISITGNTLKLSESVKLEAGKSYQIRVRYNTPTATTGSQNSTVKSFTVSTTGTYDTITVGSISVNDKIELDNLYMLGEVSKESQELVVLSIEPTGNTSARITLTDYSPEIYSTNFDSFATYNPNISLNNSSVVKTTITKSPIIDNIVSDSAISERITTGSFQNVTIVSFASVSGLTSEAQKIQLEVVLGDTEFSNESPTNVYTVSKESGSVTINGLKTMTIYKFRARYTNGTAENVGPWSDIFYHTVIGKTVSGSVAPVLSLDLDRTFIVAKPNVTLQTDDFLTYEYRLYKNTGSDDFWELDTTTYNIKIIRDTGNARFDLKDQPAPRLSTAGVTYRVACRALDKQGNYSTESTLGTIVVKTIT